MIDVVVSFYFGVGTGVSNVHPELAKSDSSRKHIKMVHISSIPPFSFHIFTKVHTKARHDTYLCTVFCV